MLPIDVFVTYPTSGSVQSRQMIRYVNTFSSESMSIFYSPSGFVSMMSLILQSNQDRKNVTLRNSGSTTNPLHICFGAPSQDGLSGSHLVLFGTSTYSILGAAFTQTYTGPIYGMYANSGTLSSSCVICMEQF